MMREIPSQKDRVSIVTGANSGIGEVTARELAMAGGHVFLACRSEERARPVVEAIREACDHEKVELLELDLASLDSVRACAEAFIERDLPLHVLINNAGLASASGTTADGFEMTFGVNHLGHFLLTNLLREPLVEAAGDAEPARVVSVASKMHRRVDDIDFERLQQATYTTTGLDEYGISKLANILFSAELARRWSGSGVHSYALHPGVVASDIWRKIPWPFDALAKKFMLTTDEGAQTSLYCATSPEVAEDSGLYYKECERCTPSRTARDPELAATLWEASLDWTGLS